MKATTRQFVRRRGAALVLAVVVTVLLAVVGVMFVMVARVGEMQTGAVIDNADLDAAVQSVTARIQQTLTQDLFGENLNEPIGKSGPEYTFAGNDPDNPAKRVNPWLASLEPKDDAGVLKWPFISEIIQSSITVEWDRQPQIVPDYQKMTKIVDGKEVLLKSDEVQKLYADADGDGVADSRWIQLPNTFTSRGKPVFAAVRIIDNCAMLNLNTAFGFYQQNNITPWYSKSWYASAAHLAANLPYETNGDYGKGLGRYISEVSYSPFLRGDDRNHIEYLMLARDPIRPPLKPLQLALSPDIYHDRIIFKVESPGSDFSLFDLGDELEMRNRFLLTSLVQARFEREGVAYNTFDWKRGEFAGGWKVALKVKRIPYDAKNEDDDEDLIMWRTRLNPANFDDTGNPAPTHPFYYDRRHISTFYSFDRQLRTGQYPLLEAEVADEAERAKLMPDKAMPIDLRTADISSDPAAVVHLLYAMREAFGNAKEAAQFVVNLIDYLDADDEVTVLDEPTFNSYVAAVGAMTNAAAFGFDAGEVFYGYERQPFITEVFTAVDNDAGGVLRFAVELYNPYDVPIDLSDWRFSVDSSIVDIPDNTVISAQSRLVLCSHEKDIQLKIADAAVYKVINTLTITNTTQKVVLERPVGSEFLAVDMIPRSYIADLTVDPASGGATYHSIKRDDNGWAFTDVSATEHKSSSTNDYELGQPNAIAATGKGYQLPVANSGTMERLTDFLQVASIGNQKGGVTPKTITEQVADAADEADVRLDIMQTPEVLDYVCFLNRPQGSLPGRININTAAVHVIAAAIPPQLVMTTGGTENALTLAQKIVDNRPYERISDLLKIDEFQKFSKAGSPNVGDAGIDNDFEERDWIVSRLANIFTVRSDTFTAYILVRLGADGPQRRMIAIFDRTNVWTKDDRPRLVALHPVPDPR